MSELSGMCMACGWWWDKALDANRICPTCSGERYMAEKAETVTTQANPPPAIDWASKTTDEILADALDLVNTINRDTTLSAASLLEAVTRHVGGALDPSTTDIRSHDPGNPAPLPAKPQVAKAAEASAFPPSVPTRHRG